MPRPINPIYAHLTEKEKRAMYARNYRARHQEEQREYQRDYQRSYNQDPVKVLARIDIRIKELVEIIERKTASYQKIIAPFEARLAAMMMRQMETESLAERGLSIPRKEKTNA